MVTIEFSENMRNMGVALHLVSKDARQKLMDAIMFLPTEVENFIVKNYVFISRDSKRAIATHFSFDEVWFKNKKGFILIDTGLWNKSEKEITFTVAHEIAHAFLGHGVKTLSKNLSSKEEKEADRTAVKWLSKHYKKDELLKLCSYLGY